MLGHALAPLQQMSISITLRSTSRCQVRLPAVWWALAILGIVATTWCRIIGLSFSDAPSKVLSSGVMAVAAIVVYWLSGLLSGGPEELTRRLSGVVESFALWTAFVPAACALCYCSATVAMPFQDDLAQQIDRWFGFDWLTWYTVVCRSVSLHWLLPWLYATR
ncbi:MAG TPA: hypothetical protein VFL55_07800 [Acetobacteraceae bacterium]|nr:hypothetical protein [Acetobacteraceae bacterium]